MKVVIGAAGIGLWALALPGCNTLGGIGKDIENTGDAIADTAESTSD